VRAHRTRRHRVDAAAPPELPAGRRVAVPGAPRSRDAATPPPRALDAGVRPRAAVAGAAVLATRPLSLDTARPSRDPPLSRSGHDTRPRTTALAGALPSPAARSPRASLAVLAREARRSRHRGVRGDQARRRRATWGGSRARDGDTRGRRLVVRAAGARGGTRAGARALRRERALRALRRPVRSAQEHGRTRVGVRARRLASPRSASGHRR